ncbi:type VII secretion protein EccCa [Actinophytocola oryzae]|uniref:S-DNA-T family DNA segregation ATPase FtsK/SpoIIIE n=1 Tax=Actinophytocola oryzae TaxID=502181 RepID=A0A4R7URC4_9PSEU|nr:type VII secretion protein EccCa [Actinophytocola oryzae]TDV34593.1 S-DNA-T family DNA segregation ATPase FtsK/SpoIIIE [Actinophytocola oryzae]
MGTVLFSRKARRFGPSTPDDEIAVQEPPSVPEQAPGGISSVLMYAPMSLSSLAMVLIFIRPGSGLIAYIGGGVMMLASIGMLVAQFMRTGVQHKQKLAGDRRDYLRYLTQLRRTVRRSLDKQQRAGRWSHPSPDALWSMAMSSRLWERRPAHEDFGDVRIGLGTQRATFKLVPPETRPVEELEPLSAHALRRFMRAYTSLPDAPIAVYLRGFARIQLHGDVEAARGLARAVLGQAATAHGPGDVRIAVCASDEARPHWDWVKWLPHAHDPDSRDAAGPRRLVTDSVTDAENLLGGGAFTGRPGFEPDTPITASEPFVILVLDGVTAAAEHRVGEEGYRNAVVLDVSGALSWQDRTHTLFLEFGANLVSSVTFDRLGNPDARPVCTPDDMTARAAATLARTMSRYRVGEAEVAEEPLATDYDLPVLLGLGDVRGFDPMRYRADRMSARRRLRVPIGIASNGQPIELDLKESAEEGMGPHGLCVGATGSGKSELLRTLVMALATTHSSEDLNFILVDFKGGAAFLGFDQLPHTSAVITNLSEELELVDRMQDALTGEMNRRQEHLRASGNYASRRDYEAARAQGVPLEPMPALFIVVDEFSEMLSSKPEFIDTFAMIGRLGRSLGVHLLLASQRLDEGRIHKVETHLSYRIGLRTFSAMESRSVIGVPDAYELPKSPGNGYLRPDTQTLVRFKAAYSSSVYRPARARARGLVNEQLVPFGTGYLPPAAQPAPVQEEPEEETPSQTMLDILIERLRDLGPRAHQVWLPPLRESPTLDQLLPPLVNHRTLGPRPVGGYGTGNLTVPVGLVDVPAQQRREPLLADLSGSKGNVAVVGAPQSGKSTVLRSIISALALTHTAAEVQFYCLDFGGTLSSLAKLPHVGSIANRLDRDRVTRTVLEICNLMSRREKLFAEHNIDSMQSYRRARANGELEVKDPYGDVFLVVDGWYTIRQDFDEVEDRFTELAARGLSFGIHLVIAAGRWSEMRPWLRDVLGTRFELRLGDPIDSEVNSRLAAKVPAVPGRGITKTLLHFLTALPRIDGSGTTDDLAEATVEMAESLALPGGPKAPKVRLLPHELPSAKLPKPTAPSPTADMRMALGMEDVALATQWLDFDANAHLLVFGDAETGKTNLLRHIAKSVAAHYGPGEARVMFADFRRELRDTIPQEHQINYTVASDGFRDAVKQAAELLASRVPGPDITPDRLPKRDWWTGGRLFILVDDFELAEGGTDPLAPLAPLLQQGSDIGLHLVVARSTAGGARAMMNPTLRRMWELGAPALMFSCPKDAGSFLGTLKPRTLPTGRVQFVNRRRAVRLVQTPLVPGAPRRSE